MPLLQDVTLSDVADVCLLTHGKVFSSHLAYSLLLPDRPIDANARYIWGPSVPIKVGILGWLLFRDRLNIMANLRRKTTSSDSSCLRCDHHLEDATHLILHCPKAAQIRGYLGLPPPSTLLDNWGYITLTGLESGTWPTVPLCIMWKI